MTDRTTPKTEQATTTRGAKKQRAREVLRERAQKTRTQARRAKDAAAVRAGRTLPVAVVMSGAGYDPADIDRNAGAVSRKLGAADAMGRTRKRLTSKSPTRVNRGGKNRKMATFPVKCYAPGRVLELLRTHRPKNPEVAARFEAVALSPRFRALALAA